MKISNKERNIITNKKSVDDFNINWHHNSVEKFFHSFQKLMLKFVLKIVFGLQNRIFRK